MRLGMQRMTIGSGRGVGRLVRLLVLVVGLLGSVLLLPAASVLAAEPPPVEPAEPPRVAPGEPPFVEPAQPPGLETSARNALLAVPNSRHGLPRGLAVPRWALQSGQHPYFTPEPSVLEKSSRKPEVEASNEKGGAEPAVSGGGLEEPLREQGPNNHLEAREGETPPLTYLGGVVEHEPKIDVVFWGSHWNEEPGSALRTKLLKYYEGLTSSAEQGILTQYFDPTGRISSTVSVHSMIDTRVGAPSNINTPVIEGEVKYAEGVLGAHNIETQYEIIPAPGSTYESEYTKHWCAFHSYTPEEAVYSFVPYQGDEPFKEKKSCASYYGNGNADDATNVMASHEYAESATDPIWEAKPGWQDLEGEEVADLCATPGDELKNGSWVQGWYDDHQNACSESDESPPDILALTGTATHVTPREATLHATINPESLATTYYFEYGLTESYGTKLPTGELSAGRANVQVSSEQLSGLELEKTYHYRVVAKNSSGTTDGEDRTFIPSRSTIQVPPRESSWGEDWLNGITCVSESSCMTVGYYYNSITSPNNRALSYQLVGGQWLQREIPLNEHERSPYLTGVSCTTSNACTAVGRIELNSSDRDSALVERWNGSTWSRQEVPLPEGSLQAELYGVACVTEAECFAVGTVESSAKVWSNFSTLWHNGSWGNSYDAYVYRIHRE